MVPQWNMDFSKVKVPEGCIVLEFYQRRIGRFGRATSIVRLKRCVRLAREV